MYPFRALHRSRRSRSGSCARQCGNSKKRKKRRFAESAVTPTHSVFVRSELDTVAGSARSIFLSMRFVQGRSETRHLQVNVRTKKRNKGESKVQNTPSENSFFSSSSRLAHFARSPVGRVD